jgi:hypothetical protein
MLGGNRVLQTEQELHVEDLRNHPPEDVERLNQLLISGATRRPDPQRRNFFEIEDRDRVFYVHISPASGKVLLLATWMQEPGR